MDYPFDPRPLPIAKSNPHNEFGAPQSPNPPQVPYGVVTRADWVLGGATRVWTFRTPIFDMRPEFAMRADVVATAGVPINHQGTYGMGSTLHLVIGGQPAAQDNLKVVWWELGDPVGGGNPATMPQLPLLILTQPEDITTELLSGGITTAGEGEGGTQLSFDAPGCRFWQVVLQFTQSAGLQPALHVRGTLGV